MSVEEGFEKTPESKYRTSKKIISLLNEKYDLFLVNPADYSMSNLEINRAFKFDGSNLTQVLNKHQPEGDMFIIYGDETSKNKGIEFGRAEYKFLKQLEKSGNFGYFFNRPSTEEATLKDNLVALHRTYPDLVAKTFFYENEDQMKSEFKKNEFLVIKPIFGCASAGVKKITSIGDLENIATKEILQKNYVFQEPLQGPEVRVILLDKTYLGSRQDINYQPWAVSPALTTMGNPSSQQIVESKELASHLGADILGVDFMGSKVYEINGTGTGLIAVNQKGNLLFDYTSNFLKFIEQKLG